MAADGAAFRNAAELAIRDFPNAGIQLAVYDTAGTPAGAQAAIGHRAPGAARRSSSARSSPPRSRRSRRAARQAGVPVVAFSSDASVAGAGRLSPQLPSRRRRGAHRLLFGDGRAEDPSRRSCRRTPMARWRRRRSAAPWRAPAAASSPSSATIPPAADIDARGGERSRPSRRRSTRSSCRTAATPLAGIAAALAAARRRRATGSSSSAAASGTIRAILANPALAGGWFPRPVEAGLRRLCRAATRRAYGTHAAAQRHPRL